MASPGRPERNRTARSFRQLRRFHHVINSDKVFGTQGGRPALCYPARDRAAAVADDLTCSRQAQEGQQTKTELVYQYLTGPRFRHRIDAIVEKFTDMQADLDRERKTMMRLWAKREEQLKGVLDSTAGLYGDLQGIAGRAMQEIESLDVLMIETDARLDE
jgi:hypothetical protein